jgi:hypothetical protein
MRMEIVTIQPTTPSTIAPPFELVIFGRAGPGVSRLGNVVPVELEDALGEDVDTPVTSIIAPEPYGRERK